MASLQGASAPGDGIRNLLTTPASAFDVYIYQLYIASNGPTFFGGPSMKEKIRIFNISYDYDSNLITMSFHISPDHELMKGFNERDLEGKKGIMLRAAKKIATDIGLEPRIDGLRHGLIQHVKIRNGWENKDFNEFDVKNEIADHTVFELVYAWEKKTVYSVLRTQSGEYRFSMDTKSIK
jgi:hypothetical protein